MLDQMQRGVLELERGTTSREIVPRLLRLAHTLKGAARVVRQREIADRAHEIEDVLVPLRDRPERSAAARRSNSCWACWTPSRATLASLSQAAASQRGRSRPRPRPRRSWAAAEPHARSSAVTSSEIEAINDGLIEVGAQLAAVRRGSEAFAARSASWPRRCTELGARPRRRCRAPSPARTRRRLRLRGAQRRAGRDRDRRQPRPGASTEQIDRELRQVREVAERMRLVPASILFAPLERAARDAAVSLGKQSEFDGHRGQDAARRRDAGRRAGRADAGHPQRRRARDRGRGRATSRGQAPDRPHRRRGRPPWQSGRVSLPRRRTRRGPGRGPACGRTHGHAGPPAASRERAAAATPAGRNQHLQQRERGRWTRRRARRGPRSDNPTARRGAPRDRARARHHAGDHRAGLQLGARRAGGRGGGTARCDPARRRARDPAAAGVRDCAFRRWRVDRAPGPGDRFRSTRCVPCATGRTGPATRLAWSAVVVASDGGLVAVGVDRLLGTDSVVCRALPDHLGVDAAVAGVSLDVEGNPRLVLDAAGLVAAAQRKQRAPELAPTTRRAHPCHRRFADHAHARAEHPRVRRLRGRGRDLRRGRTREGPPAQLRPVSGRRRDAGDGRLHLRRALARRPGHCATCRPSW